MLFVFVFIGLSFLASLLCFLIPPTVPGVAATATSLIAILALTAARLREKARDAKVVPVDGVTLDSRPAAGDQTDSPAVEELSRQLGEEQKLNATLRNDLDRTNERVVSQASFATEMRSSIGEITASQETALAESGLQAATSTLETTMRLSAGLGESVARQSVELSKTWDTLKSRRFGDELVYTTDTADEQKPLAAMASTLEELCEQSNVIAVNGAIEAARLGKEGKGFSVIAGEMQNFAGQAKELADEFRVFGATQNEKNKNDKEKAVSLLEREQTLKNAVDKAAAITINLTEDVNRLIAAGVPGEFEKLSNLVESEIETRKRNLDQLARLIRNTE